MIFRFLMILGVFIAAAAPVAATARALAPMREVPVPAKNPQTPEKIALGKKLFFDRRLSGDGTMSCATCHDPDHAFADGLDISLSYPTTRNWRNSPTLLNVGFQTCLFHDGRVLTLEEQALLPMASSFEMNRNLEFAEEVIRAVPEYVESFREVFQGEPTLERIAMAIASFERSLVSRNTPLDRYLKGDSKALSEDARKGLQIFTEKGKCVECHFGPVLSDGRFHALNLPENPDQQNDPRIAVTRRFVAKLAGMTGYRTLTRDPGRFLVTKNKKDWGAFRTPTLLEVSKTGPYMHNGVFETLDEVIDFFNRGGGSGNTVLKPLSLTEKEKRYLKVFLTEALTGENQEFEYPQVP